LAEGNQKHIFHAGADIPEPVLRPADAHGFQQFATAGGKESKRSGEDKDKNERTYHHKFLV
jgi:hypothetical protein